MGEKRRLDDIAPDWELSTVDGQQLSLSEIGHNGRHALLIFLRHLG